MKYLLSLKPIYLFLFILFIGPLSIQAQSKVDKIVSLLDKYNDYDQFNGSVLVAEKGKVIYKGGHGLANMEWDIPNDFDTKHRLGSITKQFTTMLIMQLYESGKVNLYVPITTYLPDYPKESGDIITLHHLMTHTAGIPNYTNYPGFFANKSRDAYTPTEFLEMFADSTLEFIPGEGFNYSNSGYFLLGVIIEKVTGMTYEEALHEMIFQPLGMDATGYDNHDDILPKRATGYQKNGMGYINSPYLDMSIPYAAGSMYSTAEDLYKWDRALYDHKLISKKNTDLMFADHTPAFGGSYGYGWGMRTVTLGSSEDSLATIGHGGGIHGFNTIITRIPSDQSLVVLLNNTGGTDLNKIASNILAIIYNKPYDLPKQSLATKLFSTITDEGLAAGQSLYEKNKGTTTYDLNEDDMNNVGYQLMNDGKLKEAIFVFKANMESFPKSWNTYDSYAEGLMNDGQKEEAISYYKKSIEMNPGNQNGIDMLKMMGVEEKDVVNDVKVSNEILDTYLGTYELMPGFMITITRNDNQLMAQATGQENFPVFPKSENQFYLKVVAAQLTFNKNESGVVSSVTLNQGGQELVGKKL